MTVAEASKAIGISRSELYKLLSARRIAHYRIGGKIVVSQTDIDAFLGRCRVSDTSLSAVVRRPRLKHLKLTRALPVPANTQEHG
jgi:excisionase family DNA binding protein